MSGIPGAGAEPRSRVRSNGWELTRAQSAIGETYRAAASGGLPAAMRANSAARKFCSPVPHCTSLKVMLGLALVRASMLFAIASGHHACEPPGVHNVRVVANPAFYRVGSCCTGDTPHAAKNAAPVLMSTICKKSRRLRLAKFRRRTLLLSFIACLLRHRSLPLGLSVDARFSRIPPLMANRK